MQKKWWKKSNKIIGTALITGVLALSTALLTVSCGSTDSGPTQPEEYVNNRPVKGFYYQYEDKDIDVMKEMIIYIYNNNPIKDEYIKLGHKWPAITEIKSPNIFEPKVLIDPNVFGKTYEDPIEEYGSDTVRRWRFDIYFEITDPETQKVEPKAHLSFYDWMFSFTSQKYINDVKLWHKSATEGSTDWSYGGGDLYENNTWNSPVKIKSPENVLFRLFYLRYFYANAVDTWYTVNLDDKVKRQQYWDQMVNLTASNYDYWDDVLPITE